MSIQNEHAVPSERARGVGSTTAGRGRSPTLGVSSLYPALDTFFDHICKKDRENWHAQVCSLLPLH